MKPVHMGLGVVVEAGVLVEVQEKIGGEYIIIVLLSVLSLLCLLLLEHALVYTHSIVLHLTLEIEILMI